MVTGYSTSAEQSVANEQYLLCQIAKDMYLKMPPIEHKQDVLGNEYVGWLGGTNISPEDVAEMYEDKIRVRGMREGGAERSARVLQVKLTPEAAAERGNDSITVMMPNVGDSEKAPVYDPQIKIVVERSGNDIIATTSSNSKLRGLTIGGLELQLQQKVGIDTLSSNNKHQALVYATGTGKSFVLIAPAIARGEGVFIVPNASEARKLAREIATLDKDFEPGDVATSVETKKGKEAHAFKRKYVILTMEDLERNKDRWQPHLKNRTVAIDEVHEMNRDTLRTLRDMEGTMLQMVTATWTQELQEDFGDPLVKINLHYALNELKSMRKVQADVVQFTKGQKLSDNVFKELLDYYGTIAYISEDNQDVENTKHKPRYATVEEARDRKYAEAEAKGEYPPSTAEIIRDVRKTNEMRRFDHMGMHGSKSEKVLTALTSAYQAIYDGTYERQEELAKEVSKQRATIRIREQIRLNNVLNKKPDAKIPEIDLDDDYIKTRFSTVIEESTVTAKGLQEEAERVLRQKIASNITRQIVGIFKGNTPPADIGAIERNGRLQENLEFYTDKKRRAEFKDAHHGFLAEMKKRGKDANDEDSNYDKIYKLLEGVNNRDDIMRAIKREEFTALQVDWKQLDMEHFKAKGASYVTRVKDGPGKHGAEETANRPNQGLHVHTVTDSALATGYSNPDIMSVQRWVGNNIKEAIIRATQIIGRCLRAKDGLAFVTDYVHHRLDMSKPLGEKSGRPFLMLDALKENYDELVKTFYANFKRTNDKAPPRPRNEGEDKDLEPVNKRAKAHGTKQERAK